MKRSKTVNIEKLEQRESNNRNVRKRKKRIVKRQDSKKIKKEN